MAADRPAVRPPDTLKARGRLRAAWLALGLAGTAECIAVGVCGDTPEDTLGSHQIFLSLFTVLWLQCRGCGAASDGASMLTATAWSSGTYFGPSRFPGASLPPSSSKGWTRWPSATCTASWSSSAMTDLGSRPRHPAVEQDPASTSLNSGSLCSSCDTPQFGHSSTQATPRHQQTPLQPPQLGHSLRSLRFRLRRRAS
jgi:hypothetical protein